MNRIYEDAKDLNIRKFVVYGKTADKKLYYEPEYTTQVEQADAEDAFKKGMLLIIDGSITLMPISMTGATIKTVTETGTETKTTSLVSWAVVATTA